MKILITERQYGLIQEQWWLTFAEASVSEGPGLGWGLDVDFGGGGTSNGGDPKSLKDTQVQLNKVGTLIQTATSSKSKINKKCSPYNTIKTLIADTGAIQDFLIALGHNIGRDGIFGDETATALGTYIYGAKPGINSVSKLYNKLNVPYNQIVAAVASKINELIIKVKSGCNTELTKINKSLSNLNKIQSNLKNLEDKFSPKAKYSA